METVRFGIIGCGGIGPTHAGAIRQIAGAELLAAADVLTEKAQSMGKKFDIPRLYESAEELIADPEIDAVCVCTPSGMHAAHTVAALRAGKHVVCEKPMEVSLDACDRMIAAEAESSHKLTIISQHRFDPATILVREAIESGKLGRILLADASVKWWRTQEYYDSGAWRGTWEWDGGGALMNQGVHTVDVLQWLAGGVSSLYGQTRTAAHTDIEVEDVATASLTFHNGAIGTLTATTAAYPGHAVRIDIYGTEGSAVIEGDRLKSLILKTGEEYTGEAAAAHALSVARGGTASVREESANRLLPNLTAAADPGAVWGDAHRAQIENFVHAIRTDTAPLIDGRAGRKPVEIILGVYRSARAGVPVTISPS